MLAQLVRAPACHVGGQGFKSPTSRQISYKYITMAKIINLQEYKVKKQVTNTMQSFYDLFLFMVGLFITYIINPTIAATATVQRKRVTVI